MPIVVSPALRARSGQSASDRSSGKSTTPRVRRVGGVCAIPATRRREPRPAVAAMPRPPPRNVLLFMLTPSHLARPCPRVCPARHVPRQQIEDVRADLRGVGVAFVGPVAIHLPVRARRGATVGGAPAMDRLVRLVE